MQVRFCEVLEYEMFAKFASFRDGRKGVSRLISVITLRESAHPRHFETRFLGSLPASSEPTLDLPIH